MAMKEELDKIHDDLKDAGGRAGNAYDDIKEETKKIEEGAGDADGDKLIAAMARLWLSGVQYNARATLAPGKILAELEKD